MEKRTEGAWIIHHTKKLSDIKETADFEDIEFAGKCGVFLSNLAASDEQSEISVEKVNAIARVSNIKKTELETIKGKLEDDLLIDSAKNGSISVLGVTTASVLSHTSDIFQKLVENDFQKAAISLSENISELPKSSKDLKEYISDNHRLTLSETADLLRQSEEIGFVDFEKLDDENDFYFNGNLFRKDNIEKTNGVLSSLKQDDINKINFLDQTLSANGCVLLEVAKRILGEILLSKLQAIGMYDFNEVSNSSENKTFITKPAAFSKYGSPFEEDALDLAKAFVTSLYYGINFSGINRGKITMLKKLMTKLVNGYEVGPATAIGEDYKLLELKRVIQIRHEGSYLYYMKLLKKDIGVLALEVLERGDSIEQQVTGNAISSGSITNYKGPEEKRQINRKMQSTQSKKQVAELLRTFRN